jgi:hypothetical protein
MAGDWIKMRGNLWDDTRVARICDLTSKREAEVIGGLYWLWTMADEQSYDGSLIGLSTATIDRKTGVKGLGEALLSIGWMEEIPEGLSIVRFDEHNGASAKRRALEAKRKATTRKESEKRPHEKRTKSGHHAELDKRYIDIDISPVVPTGDEHGAATAADHPSEALSRARTLFRMRESTPLDSSQDRAWKKNRAAAEATTEEDWLLLEWYFAQGGEVAQYRRRDLAQLLNNWNGEIDRARAAAKKIGFSQKKETAAIPENWREILVGLFPENYPDGLQTANFPGSFALLPASLQGEIREAVVREEVAR